MSVWVSSGENREKSSSRHKGEGTTTRQLSTLYQATSARPKPTLFSCTGTTTSVATSEPMLIEK